jgi:hypothetical protein
MRCPPPFFDFAYDAPCDVIASQQLWWAPGVLVTLGITPSLFLVISRLGFVVVGDKVEHETFAVRIGENPAFAADAFGHEHSSYAGRPNHAGGMELHILHVDQRCARMVCERVSIPGAIPTVTRDLVSFADAASREHDCLRAKNLKVSALAIVAECSNYARTIFQQRDDANLHVNIDSLMYPVVLQCSDHFEAGTIAHVRKARIFVAAKVPLQNATILRAIEHRTPRLELTHTSWRFLRVQLGHPPIVDVLPAAHRVREMHFPVVAIINIGQRGRDAAFRHDGVRLAEKTFANHAYRHAGRGCFDSCTQSRAAGTDD